MGSQMKTPGAGGRSGAWTNSCTDNAESSADHWKYQAWSRCTVCLTPVSRRHHTLCRTCFAWHVAGQHLVRYRSLTRLVVGVRT
jgi:hypothetical protein